jgi:hypothetical protein
MIGRQLGPYIISEKLGEGGMGEVYRARDTRLDRTVAIKVLPASFVCSPISCGSGCPSTGRKHCVCCGTSKRGCRGASSSPTTKSPFSVANCSDSLRFLLDWD